MGRVFSFLQLSEALETAKTIMIIVNLLILIDENGGKHHFFAVKKAMVKIVAHFACPQHAKCAFLDALPHQFFKASDTPEYRVFWQKSTGEN